MENWGWCYFSIFPTGYRGGTILVIHLSWLGIELHVLGYLGESNEKEFYLWLVEL